MADRKDTLASLATLSLDGYQEMQESLWKSYGSKKNWEEAKAMAKELARAKTQIEELREQVAQLSEENRVLMLEFTERTADEIN